MFISTQFISCLKMRKTSRLYHSRHASNENEKAPVISNLFNTPKSQCPRRSPLSIYAQEALPLINFHALLAILPQSLRTTDPPSLVYQRLPVVQRCACSALLSAPCSCLPAGVLVSHAQTKPAPPAAHARMHGGRGRLTRCTGENAGDRRTHAPAALSPDPTLLRRRCRQSACRAEVNHSARGTARRVNRGRRAVCVCPDGISLNRLLVTL